MTQPYTPSRRFQYLADYRCGCTDVQDRRKDLLSYCGKHGDDLRRVHKIPVSGPGLDKGLFA